MNCAVLFARRDSIYKTIAGCDVFDIDRDATSYSGNLPVVAHPPCRSWGNLAHFAKPRPGERDLAFFAVDQVRRCGGVLEHPVTSKLWKEANLPEPGKIDEFGGFSLPICQNWWGHKAEKRTLLYIVGCRPAEMPPMPFVMGEATHVIAQNSRMRATERRRPEVTKAEREHTPAELAIWLVELAKLCSRHKVAA